jgi:hypothetical protein
MNEVVIILLGAVVMTIAIAVIVSAARSPIGTAGQRIGTIVGGVLVYSLALMWLVFGLPRVEIAGLLPGAAIAAMVLGWIIGLVWSGSRRSAG